MRHQPDGTPDCDHYLAMAGVRRRIWCGTLPMASTHIAQVMLDVLSQGGSDLPVFAQGLQLVGADFRWHRGASQRGVLDTFIRQFREW